MEEETPGIQSASSEREESQGQYETAENMTGKAVPESRQEVTGQPEEMQEELTAEILKRYLERNEPKFESLKIYHSDQRAFPILHGLADLPAKEQKKTARKDCQHHSHIQITIHLLHVYSPPRKQSAISFTRSIN